MADDDLDPENEESAPEGFRRQIERHWKEYLPKKYRALKQSGQLEEAVREAAVLTGNALADLLHKGLPYNQAWELVREEWAFLVAEDDQEALRPQFPPHELAAITDLLRQMPTGSSQAAPSNAPAETSPPSGS